MVYKLIITDRAVELLDNIVFYLLYRFKSEQAANHLLDEILKVYDRIEVNPYQFTDCGDFYLKSMGYKEAVVTNMEYLIIFRIDNDVVYILGIFHRLENYKNKI